MKFKEKRYIKINIVYSVSVFQSKPPIPPSPQQAMIKENAAKNEIGFFSTMKRLLVNKSYLLLLVSYCVNQAILNSFSTLLNTVIEQYSYEVSKKVT